MFLATEYDNLGATEILRGFGGGEGEGHNFVVRAKKFPLPFPAFKVKANRATPAGRPAASLGLRPPSFRAINDTWPLQKTASLRLYWEIKFLVDAV